MKNYHEDKEKGFKLLIKKIILITLPSLADALLCRALIYVGSRERDREQSCSAAPYCCF